MRTDEERYQIVHGMLHGIINQLNKERLDLPDLMALTAMLFCTGLDAVPTMTLDDALERFATQVRATRDKSSTTVN